VSDSLNLGIALAIDAMREVVCCGVKFYLWDVAGSGRHETGVTTTSISVQMFREGRINSLRGLDRDNDVAGQVCDSGH
jgi:hypothetical protein